MKGVTMEAVITKATYIMGAPASLMDKIRENANYWADGDTNICLTFEQAVEIPELKSMLDEKVDGDVIVSC